MSIINKILEKFKNNKKIKVVLKNIRAVALANICISCVLILKRTFFINNTINLKVIILVITLTLLSKKVKTHQIFYMILAGIIGIIFQFAN